MVKVLIFTSSLIFFDFRDKLYQENTVLDGDRYWLSHCNPSVYFLLPFLVLIAISWERVEKNRFRSQSANVFLIRQGTKVHFSDILRRLQNLKKYLTFHWNYLVTYRHLIKVAKSQIKPHAVWVLCRFSQKWMNEFVLFAMKSKKANTTNLFVRFLGESTAHSWRRP